MRFPTSLDGAVLHFGPSPRFIGGVSSVVQMHLKMTSGQWRPRSITTWTGRRRPLDGARLAFALGVLVLARLRSARVVVFVHLSHDGSFMREGLALTVAR